MKKITETFEKVTGYEAFDGTRFTSEEECCEYEGKAVNIVYQRFLKLVVNTCDEYDIFNIFGCGSEDYDWLVLDIKDKADIETIELYSQFTGRPITVDEKYIGKRVIMSYGCSYEAHKYRYPDLRGTLDEVVDKFRTRMDECFNPKENEDEKKTE